MVFETLGPVRPSHYFTKFANARPRCMFAQQCIREANLMAQKKRVAIILAGCGAKDGSEIHEAVLTLLAVVRQGAEPVFLAPAGPQASVVNHLSGDTVAEERSMLVEAARIARGKIADLAKHNGADFDALIFPGGFGTAKNLCDFATRGSQCTVHPEVERIILEAHAAGKPMGFICIAPAIAARVLGPKGVQLTIGNEPDTAKKLTEMGAVHINKSVNEILTDRKNRVVSTPAYMLANNIAECEAGISALVTEVLEAFAF